jgi:5'-3' exonuclease
VSATIPPPTPRPPAGPAPGCDGAATGVRLLAVDGNSLGHRGFHSGRAEAERGEAPPGYVTGAVVSMLASAWHHGPYDGVVVAFDHPTNRRKGDHPEYKAHRPDSHPELAGALQQLRDHLRRAGFVVAEHEGAEADDLLAAAVDACAARGWSCDLLSSDRDLTALVGPRTRLLRPRARFADLTVEDEAAVRATYGIDPDRYVELAALRGDPSDGLSGAKGIGPKTAARLIRDHGTVANLYAALHDLPPRVEASLRASRAQVERNLLLMAPIPHLPIDVDTAVTDGIDPDRLSAALGELGLDRAARRFVRAVTEPLPPRPPVPPPPTVPDRDAAVPRPPRLRPLVTLTAAEQASLF